MRTLDQSNEHGLTEICVKDKPGHGGANHIYSINVIKSGYPLTEISFQNGPIKETGLNGCSEEDLISICIDRLVSFHYGQFSCRENALALTKLQEALHWLNDRTADRKKRKVEGTSKQ